MARVYAIASAKGGVGKTTTTANLGATLATTGADVVVIDGDIGMANLGAALGVTPNGATLHDVLSGEADPLAAAYEGPAGLTVVPGDTSLEAFAAAEPQRLEAVVDAFDDADYVLIDVGAGVSHETGVPLSVADAVVLVSTPDRDALIDTEKTRQLTERLGGVVAGAIITRTDEATPIEEVVSGILTAEILTTIPDDEAVRESIAVGEPLLSYAPHSGAAAAYRELAAALTGIDATPPEPSTADVDAETRTALAESDDQLSDSLADSGVTIDPNQASTDATGDAPTDDATSVDATSDDQSVDDASADATADTASADATSDDATADDNSDDASDEPQVVNPFAATEESDRVVKADEGESKWAEAATGSAGEADQPEFRVDTGEEADAHESVPQDAIPFSVDSSDDEADRDDADAADDESAQTTVLGAAIEDEGDEAEEASGDDTTDAEGVDDDARPLIPDAEETAAANADGSTDAESTEDGDDETDDEDDSKKGGFFSRLFG